MGALKIVTTFRSWHQLYLLRERELDETQNTYNCAQFRAFPSFQLTKIQSSLSLRHRMIHYPTEVSERSGAHQRKEQGGENERVGRVSERLNRQASGPVLPSLFLVVLAHCAASSRPDLPIHDELMSAGHKSQAIAVVERLRDILTEGVAGTSAKGGKKEDELGYQGWMLRRIYYRVKS